MQTEPGRSYWIATGLERTRPALDLRRPGEMLHRIGSVILALAWAWMLVSAVVTVARLESLDLGPWGSLQLAAVIVGPGAVGILVAMLLEAIARRQRRGAYSSVDSKSSTCPLPFSRNL
ncbi:MAG TPA: hypothetical protein VFM30_07885 [Steroidobacteraceae bacterium]|jgi:hypothetical protein|nr:hypothetical protein [Steroidobacteraceae bacterium]